VLFFSSVLAARQFHGIPVESGYPPKWQEWARDLHAMYSVDADKREESLEILPMGSETPPALRTTIRIPHIGPFHCGIQVTGRCAIAIMERITYPESALKAGATGQVTLSSTITRDGQLTRTRVMVKRFRSTREESVLLNAARQDLNTWKFDASEHNDTIQVTYSFQIDRSLSHGATPQVEWNSPGQVTVRAAPPR
jgi:TonB family protein